MWTESFQMFKLGLEKRIQIKLPTFTGCWDLKGIKKKKIYLCFINYPKFFDCVDHNKLWKTLKETGYQTTLPVLWETCKWVKKQQLELDMEQWTGSKMGKEYVKAIYCHPGYLTYMQSTSCEILGWMKHSWDQDSLEKYQQLLIHRWYHSNHRKCRGTSEPLDEGKEGEWKSWLKTQHAKSRSWRVVPSLHGK